MGAKSSVSTGDLFALAGAAARMRANRLPKSAGNFGRANRNASTLAFMVALVSPCLAFTPRITMFFESLAGK